MSGSVVATSSNAEVTSIKAFLGNMVDRVTLLQNPFHLFCLVACSLQTVLQVDIPNYVYAVCLSNLR